MAIPGELAQGERSLDGEVEAVMLMAANSGGEGQVRRHHPFAESDPARRVFEFNQNVRDGLQTSDLRRKSHV